MVKTRDPMKNFWNLAWRKKPDARMGMRIEDGQAAQAWFWSEP